MADQTKKERNKLEYLATYFFTWLSGIIIYLVAGDDNVLKFHALQAIMLGVVIFILFFVPYIGDIADLLLWLYGLYLGYEAGWEDDDMEIPFLGMYAKQWAGLK